MCVSVGERERERVCVCVFISTADSEEIKEVLINLY